MSNLPAHVNQSSIITNTDLGVRWVEELRKDIPQTTGYLKVINNVSGKSIGECCLGVVCRLVEENNLIENFGHVDKAGDFYRSYGLPGVNSFERYSSNVLLPEEVYALLTDNGTTFTDLYLRLTYDQVEAFAKDGEANFSEYGEDARAHFKERLRFMVEGSTETFALSELNDSGATFKDIANLIESFLLDPYSESWKAITR